MLPQLVADYVETGKVRLLHRDFPLPQHPYAKLAARYANAAGRLDAYSLVVNQLFRTQAQWAQDGDIASPLSQVLSPSVLQQVQTLVNDPKFDDTVEADVTMAHLEQIQGTPSMVIAHGASRKVIFGLSSYALLKGYLDDLLAGK
jgi:protein-disulfide isomerase